MTAADAGPVAIVAGGGKLPLLLEDALARAGRPRRIIALRGFADRGLCRRADALVDVLDVAGVTRRLKEWQPSSVTLAGAVTRPSPAALLGALNAWRNRDDLRDLFARGDDHLLRGVILLLEEEGMRVVGAHEILPALLAPAGQLGRIEPDAAARITIAAGLRCLADLSPHDIGQALVAEDGRILAIEGAEGTDRMLARVRDLRRGRFPFGLKRRDTPRGVLVKAAKLAQDARVDLPTIGPRTVTRAAAAGLCGIAVAAGQTIVVDREEMIAQADRLGLFLLGVDAPSGKAPAP